MSVSHTKFSVYRGHLYLLEISSLALNFRYSPQSLRGSD